MPGILTHSPADVIRQVLIDLGFGTAFGLWPVFAEGEPDKPDDCVTVYSTQGRDNGRHMPTGERPEHHGFQLRVRSSTFKEGYVKARRLAVALDTNIRLTEVTVDATDYLVWSVTRTSDVLILGKDAPGSKRSIFTVNAVASIRETGTELLLLESGGYLLLESGDRILL